MITEETTTDIEVVPDDELEDAEFLAQLQRGRATTPVTRVLLVLLVLGAGFLAGAWVQDQRGTGGGGGGLPDGAPAQLAALFAARGGAGATGAAGATGNAGGVVGTVKLVDGTNVYIEDAQGNVTKVKTTGDTTVQITEDGTVQDLGPTKTVRVEGSENDDGTYTATAITETAAGGGGFGGIPPAAAGE